MKNRCRILLLASLPVAIAVTIGVLAMLPEHSAVTKANFDRIEKGMTKPEVENIFGQGSLMVPWADPPVAALRGAENCICWVDNRNWKKPDRWAWVFFDKNGRVLHTKWVDDTPNVLDRIRHWLHLD